MAWNTELPTANTYCWKKQRKQSDGWEKPKWKQFICDVSVIHVTCTNIWKMEEDYLKWGISVHSRNNTNPFVRWQNRTCWFSQRCLDNYCVPSGHGCNFLMKKTCICLWHYWTECSKSSISETNESSKCMMKSHATQYDCVTNSLLDNAMNSVIKPEFKVSVFMPVLCIRVCVRGTSVCRWICGWYKEHRISPKWTACALVENKPCKSKGFWKQCRCFCGCCHTLKFMLIFIKQGQLKDRCSLMCV